MKRTMMRISGLLAAGVFAALGYASETLTGTVTDTMCGAKHMMADASPEKCIRECVKQGSEFGLVSGGKVYTLKGDKKQFDKYAGKDVTVNGKLEGDTMTVESMSADKTK